MKSLWEIIMIVKNAFLAYEILKLCRKVQFYEVTWRCVSADEGNALLCREFLCSWLYDKIFIWASETR